MCYATYRSKKQGNARSLKKAKQKKGENMKVKEFATQAIKNGFTGNECKGWEWIKANLSELDYIFSTAEYKKQNGMKYLCTPIIYGNTELTELEKDALDTAWYLNNDRETANKKAEHNAKMIKEGWLNLTPELVKQAFDTKKKLEVVAKMSCDWLTSSVNEVYKPVVKDNGDCYLMKGKARTRGFSLHRFENAFAKVI